MACRRKFFIALLTLCTHSLLAQQANEPVKLSHYVFNEFTPGTVKMKSGETSQQSLNYNILTNEMIFDNNGKYLAIASPENVDTVYINDRKFVPVNNKFYEVLINSQMPLLLEFTATIIEPGAPNGYGGTSSTAATTTFKSLVNSGGAYNLKLPDGYKVIPDYVYWIRKDGKEEKFNNQKQLTKIFPDKKDIIKDIIKKNDIKFSKREEVLMLIKVIEF